MLVELEVVQVSVDPFLSSPVLVLRDPESDRRVVARIGQSEAVALLAVMEKIPLDCPSAHDLALALLEATGGTLLRVEIEQRGETRTCATVVIADADGGERRLSARVVDGVAMALRAGMPIHGDDSLLEAATELDANPCAEWPGATDLLEALPDEEFPKYKM